MGRGPALECWGSLGPSLLPGAIKEAAPTCPSGPGRAAATGFTYPLASHPALHLFLGGSAPVPRSEDGWVLPLGPGWVGDAEGANRAKRATGGCVGGVPAQAPRPRIQGSESHVVLRKDLFGNPPRFLTLKNKRNPHRTGDHCDAADTQGPGSLTAHARTHARGRDHSLGRAHVFLQQVLRCHGPGQVPEGGLFWGWLDGFEIYSLRSKTQGRLVSA